MLENEVVSYNYLGKKYQAENQQFEFCINEPQSLIDTTEPSWPTI